MGQFTNLQCNDCLEYLKSMPDNSVDSLVTDPPAGISFMGKEWDSNKGGREQWIAWLETVGKELLRVLKPGAHGLVWSIPRTSHWTAFALERAGFDIRDCVTHLFGSGFPKSHDVSKAIDKMKGCGRDVNITTPASPEAKQWQGFGSSLKPAAEFWWLIRKPLSEKTVAKNVLKHGTGALNIDASRIGLNGQENPSIARYKSTPQKGNNGWEHSNRGANFDPAQANLGRFPANLLFSHNADCEELGNKEVKATRKNANQNDVKKSNTKFGQVSFNKITTNYANENGKETVPHWNCTPGCAVAQLDEQSGVLTSGSGKKSTRNNNGLYESGHKPEEKEFEASKGGASRFFYCAKASKSDRGEGNNHPTVKSSKLMSYMIKLITPPGGIVLDPFMGSGSTGKAAVQEGFSFIGIEQDKEYYDIAVKRLNLN